MTASQWLEAHHAAAAQHHEQASQYHLKASCHYVIGVDCAHVADQALATNGYGLLALNEGSAAIGRYRPQEGKELPFALGDAEHHLVAVGHRHAAIRHHGQAETHVTAEHDVRAAHETRTALDHAKHALFLGDEAAMHCAEHYGGDTCAEIV